MIQKMWMVKTETFFDRLDRAVSKIKERFICHISDILRALSDVAVSNLPSVESHSVVAGFYGINH